MLYIYSPISVLNPSIQKSSFRSYNGMNLFLMVNNMIRWCVKDNITAMETKWFSVYTKLNFEVSVAKALTRRGITNYCPVEKKIAPANFKTVYKSPIFPSYVFVKISETELGKLKKIKGVINILYCMGEPAIIAIAELELIKQFIDNHINIRIEKIALHLDDELNVNGRFVESSKNQISISSLCCNLVGEPTTKVLKSKTPKYLLDISRLRLHYALKSIFTVSIFVLSLF